MVSSRARPAGTLFGSYELIRRVAAGGMAEVHLACQRGPDGFAKQLVIKRILPHLNEDPEFVEMFIREARLASTLRHANIVQIVDFDHVEGTYFIAMEYVDGPDLRRLLSAARRQSKPVPSSVAVHIALETLKGLHVAHGRANPVVHRDISPHNLLLSYAGEVKIADFGIAKVANQHTATRTGVIKGKLGYMAPEQVRGEKVDARTDLFALGIVLWEALARRRLYEASCSEGELLAAARIGAVPNLGEIDGSLPPGLVDAVMALVAADPAARPASAQQALALLGPFASPAAVLETTRYLTEVMPPKADLPVDEVPPVSMTAPTELDVNAALPAPLPPGGRAPELEVVELEPRRRSVPEPPKLAAPLSTGVVARPERSVTVPLERRGGAAPWVVAGLVLVALVAAGLWYRYRAGDAGGVGSREALTIRSEPAGAVVEVDGIPLGQATPAVFFGPRGRRVRVVVRLRGVERSRELTLGDAAEIDFAFPSAPTPRAGAGARSAVPSRRSARTAPPVSRPRRRAARRPRHSPPRSAARGSADKEATLAPKAPIKPPVLIVPAPEEAKPVTATKPPPKKAPSKKAPAAKKKPKPPVGEGTLGW